jgi:hypothetical protein
MTMSVTRRMFSLLLLVLKGKLDQVECWFLGDVLDRAAKPKRFEAEIVFLIEGLQTTSAFLTGMLSSRFFR